MFEWRIITFSPCLHNLVKMRQTFGRIWEQISENPRWAGIFYLLENSHKLCMPKFSPGYEGTENMFWFFYQIIIFRLNKKKDDIQRGYVKSCLIHETVNFSTWRQPTIIIAQSIFMLHSTIKTQLLANQNARTVHIML